MRAPWNSDRSSERDCCSRRGTEEAIGARVLADGMDPAPNRPFFLATRSFARGQPDTLRRLMAELDETARWAQRNQPEAARMLAANMGLPEPVPQRINVADAVWTDA